MRKTPTTPSKPWSSDWKLNPVHYFAAAVLFALGCLAFWQYRTAASGLHSALPIALPAVTARFTSAERNQRALISENDEGSKAWLIKTDLLLLAPDGKQYRVHCAWSGMTCETVRSMPERALIEVVVLPVDFAPHYWLIEAKTKDDILVRASDQRRALDSKLIKDKYLAIVLLTVVPLLLWWVWWLQAPNSPRSARPR